jgi:hypothetical protein
VNADHPATDSNRKVTSAAETRHLIFRSKCKHPLLPQVGATADERMRTT